MNDAAGLLGVSLLLSLLASGCTTSKALPADEPRYLPQPMSERAGDPELTLDTASAAGFGAACQAIDTVHCGTKGRIAVVVAMRNGMPSKRKDTPCELLDLSEETAMDRGQGCVKDDRVYLTAGCPYCRQFSEWDMTGIVAEMTDGQLGNAQQRVGLAPEPKLRTVDSWRTALAAKAGKRRR